MNFDLEFPIFQQSTGNTVFDYVLLGVQILTLFAIIIYVIMTRHIANETRKSVKISNKTLEFIREVRNDENRPIIMVFFRIPYGRREIFLVIKNAGRTPATDLKLEFEPIFKTTWDDNDVKIMDWGILKRGTSILTPDQEFVSYFDDTVSYYKAKLPLKFRVEMKYKDINGKEYHNIQDLDLSPHYGRLYERVYDINELVKEMKKITTDKMPINVNIKK